MGITVLRYARSYYIVNCFILYKVHYKTQSQKDYCNSYYILQKAHVCTLLVFCGAMHKVICQKIQKKKFIQINIKAFH